MIKNPPVGGLCGVVNSVKPNEGPSRHSSIEKRKA
jgi:hypothetical protein